MVTQDLLAVKDFLWKKNNAKALNLDKLVVIGVEKGAALALSYAADDAVGYEQGQAKVGPLKLGRFVKAVVLISPADQGHGLEDAAGDEDARTICPRLAGDDCRGQQEQGDFADAEQLRQPVHEGATAGRRREARVENRMVLQRRSTRPCRGSSCWPNRR